MSTIVIGVLWVVTARVNIAINKITIHAKLQLPSTLRKLHVTDLPKKILLNFNIN